MGSFSSAIELRPLSPKDERIPEGMHTLRVVGANLSCDRPPCRSQHSFESGDFTRIFVVTTQRSFFLQSFTRNRFALSCDKVCPTILAGLCYGLTLFRTLSTSQEGPTYLPMTVLSACPHQAGKHPVIHRFGQSLSVDLALHCFTTFISGSRELTL